MAMALPIAMLLASGAKSAADGLNTSGKLSQPGDQDTYRTYRDAQGNLVSDPNAYNYAQGEDQMALARSNAAAQRSAITPDYSQAIGYMQQAGQVGGATDMYRNAALGTGYSAGQAQLAQGLAAQQANAQSIARSAGGGAYGHASAQGQVAMMDPAMRERGAQMAEMLRAQEMQQGMQGYAGAAGDMRQRYGQLADAQGQLAQGVARMQLGQTQRNDANQQFWEGLRGQSIGAQTSGAQQRTYDAATDNRYAAGMRNGVSLWNAGQNEQNAQNAMASGAAGLGYLGQAVDSMRTKKTPSDWDT